MRSVWASLLVVACSFHPRSTSSDGGTGDGSAGVDGGQVVPACATPGSFQAPFSGPMLNQWYQNMGANGVVMGGTAAMPILTLKVTGDPGSYAYVYAKHAVNLTGGSIEVQVPMVLTGSGATSFYVGVDYLHYLGFTVRNGSLIGELADGSASSSSEEITYDMATDVWWRFRESGGVVNFETSPDNSSWNARRSPVATPSWIDYVRPDLSADGSGMPGMAQFAQLDTTLAPVPWCKAETLHDAFPAGDEQWANIELGTPMPTCMYSFANDATVTFPMPATCYVGTSYAWDLTDSAFTIRWASAAPATMMFMPMVELASDNNTVEGLFMNGGSACFPAAGSNCVPYTFSPSGQDQLWRVSEVSATGTLTFESSPDGSNWTTIVSTPQPFGSNGPTAVELRLGAQATMGSGSNEVGFASVNN